MSDAEEPPRPEEAETDGVATAPAEPAGPAEPVEAVAAAEVIPAMDDDALALDDDAPLPPPAAQAVTGAAKAPPAKVPRPDLIDRREPLYRDCRGYRLRLEPPDLARLRELPGSRGKSDDEIGEAFFDGQAERLASAIADDVPTPSEIRVVVDPYSRQAFLAVAGTVRGILSF
jgi:hypothetical protein